MPNRRIQFDFDGKTFVHAAAFLVQHSKAVTKLKLAKLLYFSDKRHLLAYGRPILGDRYIRMEFGPVPSGAYDLMKHDDLADKHWQALFDHHIAVDGSALRLLRPPELNQLSDSERETLEAVTHDLGRLPAAQLSDLSHRELAWQKALPNREIDYRLMFGPNDIAVLALVEEDQALRDVLDQARFEAVFESLRA